MTATIDRTELLSLMPTARGPGGIATVLRTAWGVLSAAPRFRCRVFCYGPASGFAAWQHDHQRATLASSKAGAIAAALRGHWNPEIVIVWHLNLLRLLPFFRCNKARTILVLYGVEAWRRPDWMTRSLVLRRVHEFLSISNHTWRCFTDVVPGAASKAHRTIPLGIGTPEPLAVPSPGVPPAVLMLGRLVRSEDYKGHREVLQAWPLVLERLPNAQLWIAGDGDLLPDLRQAASSNGIQESVHFFGAVSSVRKHDLLERCRCLAMPSRGEGFGLAYLEAMRLGRPCLVGTSDAGAEVVNPPEAGLAADPGRPRELAAALCRLLTPSNEWDAWSQQARARYEASYTAKHFQDRLLAVIKRHAPT